MDGKGLQERYHGDPVLPSAGHMTSTKSELWQCKQVELGSEGCKRRESTSKHLYKPWLHRMTAILCNSTRTRQDKDEAGRALNMCE